MLGLQGLMFFLLFEDGDGLGYDALDHGILDTYNITNKYLHNSLHTYITILQITTPIVPYNSDRQHITNTLYNPYNNLHVYI